MDIKGTKTRFEVNGRVERTMENNFNVFIPSFKMKFMVNSPVNNHKRKTKKLKTRNQ